MMMMMMMMMQKKTTKMMMMMMMMMTSMGTTTHVGRDDVASSSRADCFGLFGKHPHHRRKKGAFFAKKRASSSSRHRVSLRFVSFRQRERESCFLCVHNLERKVCFGDEHSRLFELGTRIIEFFSFAIIIFIFHFSSLSRCIKTLFNQLLCFWDGIYFIFFRDF